MGRIYNCLNCANFKGCPLNFLNIECHDYQFNGVVIYDGDHTFTKIINEKGEIIKNVKK